MGSRLIDSYAAFVTERRGLLLGVITAISLLAAYGLWRFDVDEDPRAFFRRSGPDWELLEEVFRQFGADDTAAVVAVTADDLFTPPAMAALRALTDRLESLPEVLAVDSLLRSRRPDLPAVPLIPGTLTADGLRRARDRALTHPAVSRLLLSADGNTAFLIVHLADPATVISRVSPQVEAVRTAVGTAVAGTPLTARLAGAPVARVEMVATTRREILRSLASSALVTALAGFVAFRSVTATAVALAAPALGTFWALGALGLVGENLGGLNVGLPSLVFIIAFADAVHFIVEFGHSRTLGLARSAAVSAMVRAVGSACVLMVFTTVVGFGSLAIAELESIRRFGIVSAVGTLLGFVAVLTVLPWVLGSRAGDGLGRVADARAEDGHQHAGWAARWARALMRFPRASGAAAVAATAALAVFALDLQADIRWHELLPLRGAVTEALEFCDDSLGGTLGTTVVVEWPQAADPLVTAEVMREVHDVLGTGSILGRPCSALNLAAATRRDGSLDSVTLDDVGRVPLRTRDRYVRADVRRAIVTALTPDVGASRLMPECDRIEAGLRDVERNHAGYRCDLTGTAVVACRNVYSVITDAVKSLLLSSVVIIITMAIAFRSLRLGLICLVPTLFPVVVAAAGLVLTGEPLRLSSAITFSICLGLADDNTIHLVTRFQQERAAGHGVRLAVERALATCGPAMVITSATLAAGLVPMLFSPTMPMQIFGRLTIVALAASLVADLVVLPPLLAWLAEPRRAV
jgi:predicted RND superfamily exporter protein